jgi:para-nitrobenzyl esterase
MPGQWSGPRSVARIGLALITTGLVVAASAVAWASTDGGPRSSARELIVATTDGAIHGTTAGAIHEYLGIPYAAPPVGPLRWRAPRPPAHWRGIRPATRFGPHCPQPPSPGRR